MKHNQMQNAVQLLVNSHQIDCFKDLKKKHPLFVRDLIVFFLDNHEDTLSESLAEISEKEMQVCLKECARALFDQPTAETEITIHYALGKTAFEAVSAYVFDYFAGMDIQTHIEWLNTDRVRALNAGDRKVVELIGKKA